MVTDTLGPVSPTLIVSRHPENVIVPSFLQAASSQCPDLLNLGHRLGVS